MWEKSTRVETRSGRPPEKIDRVHSLLLRNKQLYAGDAGPSKRPLGTLLSRSNRVRGRSLASSERVTSECHPGSARRQPAAKTEIYRQRLPANCLEKDHPQSRTYTYNPNPTHARLWAMRRWARAVVYTHARARAVGRISCLSQRFWVWFCSAGQTPIEKIIYI